MKGAVVPNEAVMSYPPVIGCRFYCNILYPSLIPAFAGLLYQPAHISKVLSEGCSAA